jgi:hypothetical protein
MSGPRPQLPTFSPACIVEALEPRIAPALVISVGAPFDGEGRPIDPGTFNYTYAPEGATNPFQLVSPVGVETPPVYALSLGVAKGTDDVRQLNIFSGTQGFQPWITIKGSSATAFFTDANRNGVVDDNELTGIAFGNRLNLTVNGSVNGDIIGNGGGTGTSLAAPNGPSISFLRVAGSVEGSVVAAGAINKVDIAGSVDRISTASAGDIGFNFGLGERTLSAYTPAAGVAGGTLNTLTVGQAALIQAGPGGAGAAGGSIIKLTVVDDPDGLRILAGAGGDGARGGAGGSVSQVLVYGAGEPVDAKVPLEAVFIQAGDGGASAGTGGKGGGLSNISIGYGLVSGKFGPSPEPSATPVALNAGSGGDGARGGEGGAVRDIRILVNTPDRPVMDEITVAAGNGGAGTARDGNGGSITNVRAENVAFTGSDRDSIVVRAGDAGGGLGEGARGGNVSGVSVLADRVEILAGQGSQGTATGGVGGSVSKVSLLFSESEQVRSFRIEAGAGGDAATGRGGAGGSVRGVAALSVDLLNDDVFTAASRVAAGDGGSGSRGGLGGSLADVRIFEPGKTPDQAQLLFQAGSGGQGLLAGGVGGGVSGLTFIGFATLPAAQAGDGGTATSGRGGNGGSLNNVTLRSDWVLGQIKDGERLVPAAAVAAGSGGNGLGASGRGGSGGSASNLNLRVSGPLGTTSAVDAVGEPGVQPFINATPDAPALIQWQQFNPERVLVSSPAAPYLTKATLVGIQLDVASTLRGEIEVPLDPDLRASFTVSNDSPPGLPPVSVTGATARAEVRFIGGSAPDPVTSVPPNTLTLLPPRTNVVSGGEQRFDVVSIVQLPDGTLAFSNIQPLRTIKADLLSSQLDASPFFTGKGTIGMEVSPELDVSLVIPNEVDPTEVQVDTSELYMAGTVGLTYSFMERVDLAATGGRGGDGVAGVGAGGSVSRMAAATLAGNISVAAGNAGDALGPATLRANGGGVTTAMLMGSENVTIRGGDGSAGGSGGSIRTVGWLKVALDATGNLDGLLAPTGNIVVQAGHGSALGNAGGGGGSVIGASGFSSGNVNAVVLVAAGDGSGQGGGLAARGTTGGSVSNVNFFGGLAAPAVLAGHGGDAAAGSGGKGGSITSVSALPGLDLLQVAAGDGGDGPARGGLGGSVAKVDVFGDIGIRSGEAFGFATAAGGAGGIFAGAGGNGAVDGKAGRVTDVTAAAISSIVAGRPTVADPQNLALVSVVDRINLRGLGAPTLEPLPPLPGGFAPRYNGAFSEFTLPAQAPSDLYPIGRPATTAFDQANFVGSIAGDPFAPGANVYQTATGPVGSTVTPWTLGTTRPLDGLVAAITLGQNRNFRPEALLTVLDPRNPVNPVLVDYRNNFNANF